MLHRLLTVAALIALSVGGAVIAAPTVEAVPPASSGVPSEHWVGEFDAGADLEHYAEWVLDSVGVPADQQAARYPAGGCGIMTRLDMVGLFLTEQEAARANRLVGQAPLFAASTAFEVELIDPVEISGPWTAAGGSGVEQRPAGIERIGVPDDPDDIRGVRVAVVDTGVDARHDDLNVVDGRNCSGDERGPDGWGVDLHGHGTHVAGIIGARHDDAFVVGVAPGVPLIDATVFGASGGASSMTVLMGLNTALELGADVINLSLGGEHMATRCGGTDVYSSGFCKAAQQAIVVVAAGNDSVDAITKGPANVESLVTVGAIVDFDGRPGGEAIGYPGCGFAHRDDELAVFSNYGTVVDVVAPGGCILSTFPQQQWSHMSGTSMAAPHVAGVFASFLGRYPDCRGQQAVNAVIEFARKAPADYTGWPAVDPPPLIRWIPDPPDVRPAGTSPCSIEED